MFHRFSFSQPCSIETQLAAFRLAQEQLCKSEQLGRLSYVDEARSGALRIWRQMLEARSFIRDALRDSVTRAIQLLIEEEAETRAARVERGEVAARRRLFASAEADLSQILYRKGCYIEERKARRSVAWEEAQSRHEAVMQRLDNAESVERSMLYRSVDSERGALHLWMCAHHRTVSCSDEESHERLLICNAEETVHIGPLRAYHTALHNALRLWGEAMRHAELAESDARNIVSRYEEDFLWRIANAFVVELEKEARRGLEKVEHAAAQVLQDEGNALQVLNHHIALTETEARRSIGVDAQLCWATVEHSLLLHRSLLLSVGVVGEELFDSESLGRQMGETMESIARVVLFRILVALEEAAFRQATSGREILERDLITCLLCQFVVVSTYEPAQRQTLVHREQLERLTRDEWVQREHIVVCQAATAGFQFLSHEEQQKQIHNEQLYREYLAACEASTRCVVLAEPSSRYRILHQCTQDFADLWFARLVAWAPLLAQNEEFHRLALEEQALREGLLLNEWWLRGSISSTAIASEVMLRQALVQRIEALERHSVIIVVEETAQRTCLQCRLMNAAFVDVAEPVVRLSVEEEQLRELFQFVEVYDSLRRLGMDEALQWRRLSTELLTVVTEPRYRSRLVAAESDGWAFLTAAWIVTLRTDLPILELEGKRRRRLQAEERNAHGDISRQANAFCSTVADAPSDRHWCSGSPVLSRSRRTEGANSGMMFPSSRKALLDTAEALASTIARSAQRTHTREPVTPSDETEETALRCLAHEFDVVKSDDYHNASEVSRARGPVLPPQKPSGRPRHEHQLTPRQPSRYRTQVLIPQQAPW